MTMTLGVDVGGTFTDLVRYDEGGVRVAKVPSTPADQAGGILSGISRLGIDPSALGRFAHGTTVATNTVLERDGARLVLLTTAGFRDLLEIGRQDRPSLYHQDVDRPDPLVPADAVVEVAERVAADGEVLHELTDEEVERVARAVRALEPDAVAVSLLFSFRHPEHERRLADELGGIHVSTSSAILPVFREYERTSTTALNAYVAPRMERYLTSLSERLGAAGLDVPVEVMRSGGGTFTAQVAARLPVQTLLSGPAAGAWGAAAVGRALGDEQLIAFDMGGTSTDVTLISDGRPQTTAEGTIGGLPFAIRTTDIHTVGAGGGSIAWRDAGGALRVGPRSAGADPGPAAYGRGGTEPTVTDANVVLGRLPGDTRLGGDMALRPELAADALRPLASSLGLDVPRTAEGILRVVEAQMAKALRVVSVEKGHDPRGFTLVPFGGAGPLHQAQLARELGCRRVLVPPHAGVLSALGLLTAPTAVDRVRTTLTPADRLDAAALERVWGELEEDGRRLFDEQRRDVALVRRTADLRYRGQAFELEVASDPPTPDGLVEAFHDAHLERYGYAQAEEQVEVVNLRVRLEGAAPDLPLPTIGEGRGADGARTGTGQVVVDGDTRTCHRYERARLGAGDTLRGPAVVTGVDATVFVAPWQSATVDAVGALWLEEAG